MATEEQLRAALIKADQAGDTQAAELFASKIKSLREAPEQQEAVPVEAPTSEGLDEIGSAPELNALSWPAFKSSAGLLLTGDDESLRGIFKEQFGDDVNFETGSQGETIATLPSGKYVLNKPGLSPQDAIKFVSDMLAFTPAGRAQTVGRAALGAGATQAAIDVGESAIGGKDIEAQDVAEAGLLGGAFKGLENAVSSGYRYLRGTPENEIVKQGADAGVPVMTSDVLPPSTFAGKMAQQTAEKIPLAGTGAAREIQQDFRSEAVQELADKYGEFSYSKILDSLKSKKSAIKGAAGNVLQRTGDKLDSVGEIPVSNTKSAIDEVKDELTKAGVIQSDSAIGDLQKLVEAIDSAPQTFTSLKENRTAFRDIMQGADKAERSQLPSRAKSLLGKVGKAMSDDMESFAKQNLTPKEFTSWKKANSVYAQEAKELTKSKLKNVLDKGEVTPESVKGMLFSKNKSDMDSLYKSLGQSGRQNARAAIVSQIVDNVSRRAGGMTPNSFASELGKFKPQIDVFFKGKEKQQLEGLKRLLDSTRRAQEAAVTTPTGQQVLGAGTLAAAATDLGATALTGGTVGSVARIYESAPVRDALLRLASAPKGSTKFEKALLDAQTAMNALAQSERAEQSEQE